LYISKAPTPKNTEKLSEEEFDIDLKNEKVVCPEGRVADSIHCFEEFSPAS